MIGKVKKYTLATRGGENSPICLPVIYYEVDGKTYKVIGPEYKEYIIKSISSPTMGKLYPIGSEIEVHYSQKIQNYHTQ